MVSSALFNCTSITRKRSSKSSSAVFSPRLLVASFADAMLFLFAGLGGVTKGKLCRLWCGDKPPPPPPTTQEASQQTLRGVSLVRRQSKHPMMGVANRHIIQTSSSQQHAIRPPGLKFR
eukprot:scaffold28775_cov39-Attheya_sp.AAC.1